MMQYIKGHTIRFHFVEEKRGKDEKTMQLYYFNLYKLMTNVPVRLVHFGSLTIIVYKTLS